ncbi:hypothetical protein [Salinarchaeum laminariae]|uniref:hypothetical protein n=1 Tax=Salinarchaeum laminariae TaxID=869888 RepID=UPI0020BE5A6D|nr:hypothetical protein [Salinarchaeum laminariae]
MDRVPIVQSVVVGIVSYVVSFALVAMVVAGMEDGDDLVGAAGNILYGAHFVDAKYTVSAGGQSQSETHNFISESSLEAPEFLYQIIPIVVLLVAGIALVRYLEIPDETDAAIAGAALAIGYVVLTIVGTFVFELSDTQMGITAEVVPKLGLMTVLLMGIVYPVVIGGIGGYVGSRL